MKKNKLLNKYFVTFFLILILFTISIPVLGSGAKIEFVDEPTYYLYKQTNAGNFYLINVTLKNMGDERSCPIDIKIKEDGLNSVCPDDCRRVVFEPSEKKSFSIEWGTPESKDQIEVAYIASDPINISLSNTGNKTVTIGQTKNNENKGIPGFSFLILLLSFALLVILYSKKRN